MMTKDLDPLRSLLLGLGIALLLLGLNNLSCLLLLGSFRLGPHYVVYLTITVVALILGPMLLIFRGQLAKK